MFLVGGGGYSEGFVEVVTVSLRGFSLLALVLCGCSFRGPESEVARQPAPLPVFTATPEPYKVRTLETGRVLRRTRPRPPVVAPVEPDVAPVVVAPTVAPTAAQAVVRVQKPALPGPAKVPSAVSARPGKKGPVEEVDVVPPGAAGADAVDADAPVEIEVVPPPDWPKQRPDPQSVLLTPDAPHFGYTYSRSLLNLQRDGNLQIELVGTGHTNVAVQVFNTGRKALHFYLFPGMIFKPKKNTMYSPLVLASLQEVTLYPGTREQFRFQCYSLERKKPLPDERSPVSYRLEPDRDSRYPRALRILSAMLAEEALPEQKPDYQNNRPLIVQFALWQATSGRYDPRREFAREVGPVNREELESRRQVVFDNVSRLVRAADAL